MIKTALVTGSTDGIGKQTALQLALQGFVVWIHGKSKSKVDQVIEELLEQSNNPHIFGVTTDFSSLKEVKRLSMQLSEEIECLDVLINNAGMMSDFNETTIDGYNKLFQVNYLSPFLLTNALLPLMNEADQGRIIHVASDIHASGIDFQNLTFSDSYHGKQAYEASKLYNILFSNKLSRMLAGNKITSNSLHPGVINTKLLIQNYGNIGDPIEQGAQTSIYLALAAELANISGKYFSNSHRTNPKKITQDKAIQDKLWNMSLQMVANYLGQE